MAGCRRWQPQGDGSWLKRRKGARSTVGRVVFRSWEHQWITGEPWVASVASASRLLPERRTAPIYDILKRWEQSLLRASLPFAPHDVRIVEENELLAYENYDDHFPDWVRRALPIGQICPDWEEALRKKRLLLAKGPREKPLKSGLILKVPSGETPLNCVYEVEWRCVCLPAYIDVFLREFSPRHKQRLAGT